ncbi:trypsin-like serine peptidase [Shimia sp.]|uniref:trypsin-like serine peptidase n=1 Tax=Shimia sp. TaxID=1954381 RepID=UPI003B8DF853
MRFPIILSVLVALISALPAVSEQRLQPLRTRADLLGWEALGRLDLATTGYCSAALIAPDQVLTAAHCLFDGEGKRVAADKITFRAGYVEGVALAERSVDRVVVDAGYLDDASPKIRPQMMRHDVALLRLSAPILSDVADPFVIHTDPQDGDEVSVLSYGRGRSEHLSWQRDCSVLSQGWGLLTLDCDVTYGSSGAPVFVRHGNRMRILSVISATGETAEGIKRSYGMALTDAVAELKRRLRVEDAPSVRSTGGAKRSQIGNRSGTGAKFIRADGG